jgi:N-acyl-D-amino-acid deacylase
MQAEVAKAMDEGAIGLSTGLIYPPGSYAGTEELIALTERVGERDGFYFSHIRGEGRELLEAVSEAIRIGRETGAAVQISHFKATGRENWDKSAQALALIDEARAEGLDVTADLYPYLATSTNLGATLPDWAHEGGRTATLRRLGDSAERRRMKADMQSAGYDEDEWENVLISRVARTPAYAGRYVSDLATEAGEAPHTWVFDTLLEAEMDVSMIHFAMCEENRDRELRHPAMMIGTDGSGRTPEGPLGKGKPHPRNYGAFPRVLGRYVRERNVISLEEAIYKMTGLPAQKLRWTDRGRLEEGYQADLVILDPETVIDEATYEDPHRFPRGIMAVMVNGTLVVDGGRHTGALPGRTLSL